MINYEIFTQIYVLQGFNAKEGKRVDKSAKMAKIGKWKISRHNFTISRQNPKTTCRSLSQQVEPCRNKDKAECKIIVERLSQHNMRRSTRKMLQYKNECHNQGTKFSKFRLSVVINKISPPKFRFSQLFSIFSSKFQKFSHFFLWLQKSQKNASRVSNPPKMLESGTLQPPSH